MRYLLIICHDDAFRPTEELVQKIHRWGNGMQKRGVRVHGLPLRPACEATTVRVRDGKTQIKPGPLSTSRQQICAYELIESADQHEAASLAAEHPMAAVATIEVRPVWCELAS